MTSAIATGKLLFTPRIASLYDYAVLWILVLAIALVITAGLLFSAPATLVQGLYSSVEGLDLSEILPWIGFMMSGAAGLIWFSYWLSARGFGAALGEHEGREGTPNGMTADKYAPLNEHEVSEAKRWIRLMTTSTVVSSALILVLLISLLVLGTELLRPEGLVPEGDAVTDVLSRLLGAVWGPVGTWTMIVAAFIAFWSPVITNLDGWSRMFTESLGLLLKQLAPRSTPVRPRTCGSSSFSGSWGSCLQ
ncbi:MAG: hypothetical protein SA339_01910 [Methanomassiliicoccus sp.]|nr:hypothetical protein [Methanomassiliicoccus sp.]